MSEWKKMKLGELCDFINGGAWSDKEYVSEGIPVLKVTNCKNSGFSLSELSYLPYSLEQKYIQNKLQRYDVIIATVGSHPNLVNSSAGRSVIANSFVEGFYLNQNAVCIRTKDEDVLDQLFWGYYSKYYLFQHYIQMRGKGAANQMRIAISAIKEYPMPLPSINVQRHIASILFRYDSLIENYQKQIKLLEEAAQRLYKEWFVDLHFPGHENTKIVDGVPEGWEKKTLGELISYVRGKSYSSNEISDEGCIMVNLKNIQAFGGYKRDAEKRFIGEYKPEQTLKKGDLVMGVTDMTQERRLVGHVALIPDFNEPATFSMDLIKIIPYSIPIIYLYCAMRYGGISKQISPLANGVNVLHLKPDTIMGTMMVVPRKDLIERFCPFVEEMTNKILKNQSQIRLLTEARDRLLPKLMSGEIKA